MDLIQKDEERLKVFEEKSSELRDLSGTMQITCFGTSIWDETLYKAWSSIVYSLVPNVDKLEKQLDKFCNLCQVNTIFSWPLEAQRNYLGLWSILRLMKWFSLRKQPFLLFLIQLTRSTQMCTGLVFFF